MSRLLIATLVLTALVVAGFALLRAFRAGLTPDPDATTGATALQRISFLLLIALIFYVSLWGGA